MLAAISQVILAYCIGFLKPGGKCRRTGTQISRALGHAMSLFGLQGELDSVFQYAYQFVTHFEGRVGRVWASVRREFRGDLSRP